MKNNFKSGSTESFDANWKKRPETQYNHWCKGEPKNQIQLAFKQHYSLFNQLIGKKDRLKVLEMGCGRGSLSSHFAENEHECHLLDISDSVIQTAKSIYSSNQHKANFYVANAEKTDFDNNTFDFIVSIGVLEHFENLIPIIKEQYRILKKGGLVINYVVPENLENIQKEFFWFNEILKNYNHANSNQDVPKQEVFRSDSNSKRYTDVYKKIGFKKIESYGVYPLPMISHSIEFPFTLMDPKSEQILVNHFNKILEERKKLDFIHPWVCEEELGQAFIVTGKKK